MTGSLGEAFVEVGADFGPFEGDVDKGVKKGLGGVSTKSGKSLGVRMSGAIGKTLKRGAIVAGAAAVAGIGYSIAKGFSRLTGIEQAEAKLKGLGNTTKSVDRIMKNANASVLGTAYGLDSAATVAAQAVAAGVKPGKDLTKTLKLVGDASTITGSTMEDMGTIFAKVASSGKIQGDVMRQFSMRGVDVTTLLSKSMGKSREEIGKLSKAGKIGFKQFQDAMQSGLGGAALKAGKTFSGAMANTKAAAGRLGASVLKGAFSKIPAMLASVIKGLDTLGPAAEKVGEIVGDKFASAWKTASTWLDKNKDSIKKTASELGSSLGPALGDVIKASGDFLKATMGIAGPLAKTLAPAVVIVAKALGGIARVFSALPDPMKKVLVVWGLLWMAGARWTAMMASDTSATAANIVATKAWGTSMMTSAGRAQFATVAMAKLAAVAKLAAGAAGVMLLVDSFQKAGRSATTFKTTMTSALGGAGVGFAAGGPWGAAIGAIVGAGAGAILSSKRLDSATRKAAAGIDRMADAADGTKPHLASYAKTLDQVTGAATDATRASVKQKLEQDGILSQARTIGVSTRDLIGASLGQADALKRVNAAWGKNGSVLDGITHTHIAAWVDKQNAAFKRQRDQIRKNSSDISKYTHGDLKQLSKPLRLQVEQFGVKPAAKDIATLAVQYKKVRDVKTIKTLIKMSGATASVKQIQRLAEEMKKTGNTKVKGDPFMRSFEGLMGKANGIAKRGSKSNNRELGKSGNVSANMSTFIGSITSGTNRASGVAHSGAAGVGASLKSGLLAGMAGMATAAATEVTSAVRAALAAGRSKKGADSNSPSKKTMKIGKDLGLGLILGIRWHGKRIKRSGYGLIKQFRLGVMQGEKGIGKVLGRVTKAISKALSHKSISKKAARRMNKVVRQQGKALQKIGRLWDKHYAKMKALQGSRKSMIAGIRSSVKGELDLGSLSAEKNDYGFTTSGSLSFSSVSGQVKQLAARAQTFATRIKQMLKKGIPRGLVQEVAALGSKDGIKVADALLSGTGGQVTALKKDYANIGKFGQQAGVALGNSFYNAGINGQEAILRGLTRKKGLKKAANKLAHSLTKAIRNALKMHSPSKLLMDEIGNPAGDSIGLGMVKSVSGYSNRVAQAMADVQAPRFRPGQSTGSSTPTGPTIDYDRLAEAMARVKIKSTLQVNNRQAGVLVQTGQQTIERQR